MFMKAIGVTMTHIPFRGTADEMTAMVGGHIDLAIDSTTTIWPIAKAGDVRPLAVTMPRRVATAPGPPDHRRNGPGLRSHRLAGPVRTGQTPRPIVEELAAEVNESSCNRGSSRRCRTSATNLCP